MRWSIWARRGESQIGDRPASNASGDIRTGATTTAVVPALSRDPYSQPDIWEDRVAAVRRNNKRRWLWVLACARTTAVLTKQAITSPTLSSSPSRHHHQHHDHHIRITA